MALETKPAKDPAAEDKHELDPKRKAALDTALAQVEKSFGKGSAMRLGDQPEQNVEVIPTGSLALDMALGIGGKVEMMQGMAAVVIGGLSVSTLLTLFLVPILYRSSERLSERLAERTKRRRMQRGDYSS